MAISYTVFKESCPHCGEVYKIKSTFPYVFLILLSGFFALSWVFSYFIIQKLFDEPCILRLGSPYRKCRSCGKKFLTNERLEWNAFNSKCKKSWSCRHNLRLIYLVSGFIPILVLFQFFWGSNHRFDRIVALIALILAIVLILLIFLARYFWIKYTQSSEIVLSRLDFKRVKKSLDRTGDDLNWEEPSLTIKGSNIFYGADYNGLKKSSTK